VFRVTRVAVGQRHCNTLVLRRIMIRLHDRFGEKMPNVDYELEYAGQRTKGKADGEGFVRVGLTDGSERCTIRWELLQDASEPPRLFNYELELFLEPLDLEREESLCHHLHNLGYGFERDLERNLYDFQAHHGLDVTGVLDEPTKTKLRKIYDDILDEVSELDSAESDDAPPDDHRT